MGEVEQIHREVLRRPAEGPALFFELLEAFPDREYRDILRAWSTVREGTALERTDAGHYRLGAGPAGGADGGDR